MSEVVNGTFQQSFSIFPGDLMGTIWMATAILIGMASILGVIIHEFVFMNPAAKKMRKAKFGNAVCSFIQDDTGNVDFTISDKQLPEGVVHTKRGWFLLPRPEAIPTEVEVKRGPGRPRKENPDGSVDVDIVTDPQVPKKLSKEEKLKQREEYIRLHGQMLHVPTLRGLGKQVFFGATSSAMITNLWTLAHADLLESKKLLPTNTQKTQLDALATYNRIEGTNMFSGDVKKLILYAIVAVIIIVPIGLIIYLIKG